MMIRVGTRCRVRCPGCGKDVSVVENICGRKASRNHYGLPAVACRFRVAHTHYFCSLSLAGCGRFWVRTH